MNRIATHNGATAFTAKNCPGYTEEHPASLDNLKAQAEAMNTKAKTLGIQTRYEVQTA